MEKVTGNSTNLCKTKPKAKRDGFRITVEYNQNDTQDIKVITMRKPSPEARERMKQLYEGNIP